MTEQPTKYRFMPSMTPGFYCVIDRATETRVPGIVTTSGEAGNRVHTYQRMLPPDAGHKKAWAAKTITATHTRELSQLIDEYFQSEQVPS